MKRIEVQLNLPLVAPLLDVIKDLVAATRDVPSVPAALPDPASEFGAFWASELIAAQNQDSGVLLALFGEKFFSNGTVCFDPDNAEAIVRACSAVRLKLRERFLKPLGDEALETGEVEGQQIEEGVRKAFMCYLLLAKIQEVIIEYMEE